MVKIIMLIILFWVILGWAFYSNLITDLWPLISSINSDLIAYLPVELRIFISIIFFAILIKIAYKFI
jgi:hypothetical protein